jgi:hypothetical protein
MPLRRKQMTLKPNHNTGTALAEAVVKEDQSFLTKSTSAKMQKTAKYDT